MYLLLASLVSSLAFAQDGDGPGHPTGGGPLQGPFSECGTRPPPCIKVLDSDSTILPSDWFWAEFEALDGELNYFRIETFVYSGKPLIAVGGYELTEEWLSVEESGEGLNVYYVPAVEDAEISFHVGSREGAELDFILTGAAKAPF